MLDEKQSARISAAGVCVAANQVCFYLIDLKFTIGVAHAIAVEVLVHPRLIQMLTAQMVVVISPQTCVEWILYLTEVRNICLRRVYSYSSGDYALNFTKRALECHLSQSQGNELALDCAVPEVTQRPLSV